MYRQDNPDVVRRATRAYDEVLPAKKKKKKISAVGQTKMNRREVEMRKHGREGTHAEGREGILTACLMC